MRKAILGLTVASVLVGTVLSAGADSVQERMKVDFRETISAAKSKVFPAVVFIRVTSEDFDSGARGNVESSGSGALISADGEVITNWHVVDRAVDVRCLLADGRALKAKILGVDKDTDIALLKLEGLTDSLPFAEIGDSTVLREGAFVMAMGAPWGLSRSVSIGIVSCVDRYLNEASEYSLWLQTDASISPGNSGGPLVNTDGQIIGLNARGSGGGGGDLGFAIPSETLKAVVPNLRQHGRVPWSYTGLQLQPLHDFNKDIYFEGDTGVMIADVDPESPAKMIGLQSRDRLLAIDGKPVKGMTDEDLPAIRRTLAQLTADKPVTLSIQRGTETKEYQITPREKGKTQGDQLECPRWDFSVKTINQFDNPDLFYQRKSGIFVTGVKHPGNAATSGLQEKDILVQIDGKDVATLNEVKTLQEKLVADVENNHRTLIVVLRNGLTRQIVLDFARDYSKK